MTAHPCPMCGGGEHGDWRPVSPLDQPLADALNALTATNNHDRKD